MLYVGTDGKLYGGWNVGNSASSIQVTSNAPVNDGQWHDVALVVDGAAQTATLYLDGQLVGSASSQYITVSFDQIGTGFTEPETGTAPGRRHPGAGTASSARSTMFVSGARRERPARSART